MATRTWVSGVGDDANPGSRTAPCKTFAGAISKTDAKGEINVVDPGGFGAITITKAVTIDGGGAFASVLASGTAAITVNAGPKDIVTIRNLSLNGIGSGLDGIHFLAGAALHIEHCVIFGFARRGVFFEPSGASWLFIADTNIHTNNDPTNGGGVLIQPQAVGSANATLDNVRLEGNLFGVSASDRATVSIRRSLIAGCTTFGVIAKSTAALSVINLDTCVLVENNVTANSTAAAGVGAQGVVRLTNTTILDNSVGVAVATGGFIVTYGNNRIAHNVVNGAPNLVEAQV